MQPCCITEMPQTLQYRLWSQRTLLEIKNILFSFKRVHPPGWNFEVWGRCFLDICVYLQYVKLPVWLQQPLASPTHMSHSFRTEGRTASVGKTPICLASLRKLRQPWLTGWAKGPACGFWGGHYLAWWPSDYLFKSQDKTWARNNARFTAYHFKICQRRDKLIFVIIFVWSNEATSSCSHNLDQPSASRSLCLTEQERRRHENLHAAVLSSNASVELKG